MSLLPFFVWGQAESFGKGQQHIFRKKCNLLKFTQWSNPSFCYLLLYDHLKHPSPFQKSGTLHSGFWSGIEQGCRGLCECALGSIHIVVHNKKN